MSDVPQRLEPIISIGYYENDDGTFRAVMVVSGLRSEEVAARACDHMERLFCGAEVENPQ